MICERFVFFVLLQVLFGTIRMQQCNQALVQSYNLKGVATADYIMLNMCPDVQLSCCLEEDQLQIYSKFAISKVDEEIKDWTTKITNLYQTVMKIFNIAEKYAKQIEKLHRKKQFGNCKLLAERIIDYNNSENMHLIMDNIKKYSKFLLQSHKGLYCAICDQKMHQFFNSGKAKIELSETYCRKGVQSNLQALLYIHIHFPKVANLVTYFLSTCNHHGVYELDVIIPKNVEFTIDNKYYKKYNHLNECRKFRNTKDWLVYCKPVCENFNVAKFNKYFVGEYAKFLNFIEYNKKKIQEIEIERNKLPVFQSRVLQFIEEKKKVKQRRLKTVQRLDKKNPVLYQKKLGALINLALFSSKVEPIGIDFQRIGKNSQINKKMFEMIKKNTNLKQQKSINEQKKELNVQEQSMSKKRVIRE